MSKQDAVKEKLKEAKAKKELSDDELGKVSGGTGGNTYDPSDPGKPGEDGWSDGYK